MKTSKLYGLISLATIIGTGPLTAQGAVTAPVPAPTVKSVPGKAGADTTVRYVIPDRDKVKITLRAGYTYAAMLDGREITLQVKPTVENLRDPAMGDVSLPSEKVSRFTIQVEDTGDYEFALIGVMPGRDVVMMLTGPLPVKKRY